MVWDSLGALCRGGMVTIEGAAEGPLSGLYFAAKDVFDVAGRVTGCGNPTWFGTHGPAAATAPAVQALIDAGATLVGKTLTDELAFSLTGENVHYGTPVNPAAPGRIPGGSSSGSASAVAGRLFDFALGTDTGGSVRIPAGFCGLFGFRPSHGRIATGNVVPLAPSFDTIGWFTRDADLLARVGGILLGTVEDAPCPRGVLVVEDAFALADPVVRASLGPVIDAVTAALGPPRNVTLSRFGLHTWFPHFRVLQGREAWACHGAWIGEAKPGFGSGIGERFAWAATVTDAAVAESSAFRARMTETLDDLLANNDLLCLPTAPCIAPLRNSPGAVLDDFRSRAQSLLCIAGLAGLPQVTLPLGEADGCPIGLSLIARRGGDAMLLEAARRAAL